MSLTAQAGFAFGVGVAAFFSPCAFALLPGYVSYYLATVEGETAPLAGALARGSAASIGAVGTFLVLSVVAFAAGEVLERTIPVLEYLVGVALVVLGVAILGRRTVSVGVSLPKRRAGVVGFGVFGAMYALAATACVLPLFLSVSVLSVSLSAGGTALVLGSYAAGFALLMLAATVMTAVGHRALLDSAVARAETLTTVAGAALVLAGLVQLAIAYAVEPVEVLPLA